MNTAISERRIKNNRIRRRRQLRRHIGMSILAVIFAIGLSLSLFSLKAKAQDDQEDIYYKYYKSIVVEEGDTLWGYAVAYGNGQYDTCQDYINEVVYMNSLHNTDIITGQSIIVPYYSVEFVQ